MIWYVFVMAEEWMTNQIAALQNKKKVNIQRGEFSKYINNAICNSLNIYSSVWYIDGHDIYKVNLKNIDSNSAVVYVVGSEPDKCNRMEEVDLTDLVSKHTSSYICNVIFFLKFIAIICNN